MSKSKKTSKNFIDPDDLVKEEEDNGEEDEGTGGIMLDKDDIKLIHKVLKRYKPTGDEEHLHSILLEQFEEILHSDYVEVSTK